MKTINKTQLFKHLKPGAKVEMISFHNLETVPTKLQGVRTVETANTVGIKFNTGSWLYKTEVDAKNLETYFKDGKVVVSIGWAEYILLDAMTYATGEILI